MRSNSGVHPGQVWQSSDPRRLNSFKVEEIVSDVVVVRNLYPPADHGRVVPFRTFQLTGTKGYTRIS